MIYVIYIHAQQAAAYEKYGAKAFQVPLTAKPRLYDSLLEASRNLPVSLPLSSVSPSPPPKEPSSNVLLRCPSS